MTSKIRRYQLFAIVAASLMVTAEIRAQGIYNNEWGDTSYDLFIQINSYSGSCGGVSVWSYLNGNYGSGANVFQEILTAAPNTDYVWNWGFGAYINTSGGCVYWSLGSFYDLIGYRDTFYGPPPSTIGSTCYYNNLACTSGTPTCNPSTPGFTFSSSCPDYMLGLYVVLNGTECIVGVGVPSPGGGHCT